MVKILLVLIVIAVLMEDGSSIKKTPEEEKEDQEIAAAVNRTLAEEAEKKEEEEKKKKLDQGKKKTDEVKDRKKKKTDIEEQMGQGEDCPNANLTCPEVKPCLPCKEEDCPQKECPECQDCKDKECGPCPEVKPCKPCGPCPATNTTRGHQECSELPACPDAGMSVPVAMAVGAVASLTITGAVAALGLLLRYAHPFVSGFLFLFFVAITWYLSSHYPETARELGGRVVAILREATVALGHRIVEAIQRHQEQVGVPSKPIFLFRMSSMFI
jgi:hypothetical protein